MAITVTDIEQKEFIYKGAGYDPYDVDQYLDQICEEMIAMQSRIDELDAQLKQAQAELEAERSSVKPIPQDVVKADERPVSKTSETLENILLTAQRIGDEAVQEARKRAEGIVKEAKEKAATLLDEAQNERGALQKELDTLKDASVSYKKRLKDMLDEYRKLLEKHDEQ